MKTEHHIVLSTRFVATLCHFVALIIVACTKEANIAVGLKDFPSKSTEDAARAEVDVSQPTMVVYAIKIAIQTFIIIIIIDYRVRSRSDWLASRLTSSVYSGASPYSSRRYSKNMLD
jgi:hypothetical protein